MVHIVTSTMHLPSSAKHNMWYFVYVRIMELGHHWGVLLKYGITRYTPFPSSPSTYNEQYIE